MRAAESVADDVDEIYLVDNGSRARDLAALSRFAAQRQMELVLNERNLGYAGGNNRGLARAIADGYELILVMNNDALAEPGAIRAMVDRLDLAGETGAVAPVEIDMESGRVIHSRCRLDAQTATTAFDDVGRWPDEIASDPMPTDYVSGAAFLVRSRTLRDCGTFDEAFFAYYEDADWSLRVRRAGWKLEVIPAAVFRHSVNATSSGVLAAYLMARGRPLLLRRSLGRSRLGAARITLPHMIWTMGWFLRRRRAREALSGVLAGWVNGVASLRSRPANRRLADSAESSREAASE
jgi:GT2 family glycosyltransferase